MTEPLRKIRNRALSSFQTGFKRVADMGWARGEHVGPKVIAVSDSVATQNFALHASIVFKNALQGRCMASMRV